MLQKTELKSIVKANYQDKLIKNPKRDFEKAINCYLSGEVGKFGKYFSLPNALVYRTIITKEYGSKQTLGQDVIAMTLPSGEIIGNSAILPLIGRSVSFGHERLNRGVTEVQEILGDIVPMLPFSVFKEAGLSLSDMEILDRSPEETINRRYDNEDFSRYDREISLERGESYDIPEFIYRDVHFTGASLYKIEDKLFLFDIDREEIKHGIFNAFLVNIPKKVSTIDEAYHALKPNEVLEAEKNGTKVVRQGEWFFIESEVKPDSEIRVYGDKKNSDINSWAYETYELRAGQSRPNIAQLGFEMKGDHYVQGFVEHEGREHRTIELGFKKWFKVVPNTAIESFTIEGDID